MEVHKENRVRKKIKGKKFVKDKDGHTSNVCSSSVDTPECLSAENVQRESLESIEIPAEMVSSTPSTFQGRSEEAKTNSLESDSTPAPTTAPSGVPERETPKCIPADVRNGGDEEKADQPEVLSSYSYGRPQEDTETSPTSAESVEAESLVKCYEVSIHGHSTSAAGETTESDNSAAQDQKQLLQESLSNLNPTGPEAEKCPETDVLRNTIGTAAVSSLDLSTTCSSSKDCEHIADNCEQPKTPLMPDDIQSVPACVRSKSPVASSNPSAPCLVTTADEFPAQKVQASLRWVEEPAVILPTVAQSTTQEISIDTFNLRTSETQIPEVRPFITEFANCFPIQSERVQVKPPLEKIPLKISWAELEQQIELTLDESEDEAWTSIEYYRMILREDLLPERRKKAESNAENMSLRGKSNNGSALSIKVSDSMKNLYSGTSLLHRSEHTQHECKCTPLSCQNPHPIYAYGAICQQHIPSKHNHQAGGQDFYPCANSYGVCHHQCQKYKKKCHLQLQPYHAHTSHQQVPGNKQQETWLNKTKSILSRAKNVFRTSFQFKSVRKNQSEAGKNTNVTHGSSCDVNSSSADMQEPRPAISEQVAQVMTAMSMSMNDDSPSAQLMFS